MADKYFVNVTRLQALENKARELNTEVSVTDTYLLNTKAVKFNLFNSNSKEGSIYANPDESKVVELSLIEWFNSKNPQMPIVKQRVDMDAAKDLYDYLKNKLKKSFAIYDVTGDCVIPEQRVRKDDADSVGYHCFVLRDIPFYFKKISGYGTVFGIALPVVPHTDPLPVDNGSTSLLAATTDDFSDPNFLKDAKTLYQDLIGDKKLYDETGQIRKKAQ